MTIPDIREICVRYAVPYRYRSPQQITGKFGNLRIENDRILVEFIDYRRVAPLTNLKRRFAIRRLTRAGLVKGTVQLLGEFNFSAEVKPIAIACALKIIGALAGGKRRAYCGSPLPSNPTGKAATAGA